MGETEKNVQQSACICSNFSVVHSYEKSPKILRLRTIAQICRAISSQLRHVSTIEKNLLSPNISPIYPHNIVNFGQLAAEIDPLVWGTVQISTGFAFWQPYCTALEYWALATLCGVEQRAPPIFGRAAITLGIGPHSSSSSFFFLSSFFLA